MFGIFKKNSVDEFKDRETLRQYALWVNDTETGRMAFIVNKPFNRISLQELERMIEKYKSGDRKVFHRGLRVLVNNNSGFNRGAKGTVEFVEPNGNVWVLRDGASSPCYFSPDELDIIKVTDTTSGGLMI